MKRECASGIGWLAVLSALLPQMAFGGSAGLDARPNIILITIDTLRADHLGCYGYDQARTPVIDELAAHGVRFSQATAQVPLTLPSHYSILSGTLPIDHGVHDNSAGNPGGPPLISQILKKNGYQTAAFVGSYVLDSSFGLDRGFDTYFDKFDVSMVASNDLSTLRWPAETVVQRAMHWISSTHAPFFVWIHFYDLHTPYSPPERFRQSFPQSSYDAEIAYVDTSLGVLLDNLRAKGLSGKTDIVLTADHGEGLGDHQEPGHGYFVYESTLHVPLVAYVPKSHSSARVVDRVVESIDIAPTIVALAGIAGSRAMQGNPLCEVLKDACAGEQAPRQRWVYFESTYPKRELGWAPLRGLRSDGFKYIDAPRPELYDLRADGGEQHNLMNERPAVAAEIKRKLDAMIQESPRNPASPPPNLSVESQRRLAALGYLAGSDGTSISVGKHVLKDPKDGLASYLSISQALQLVNAGESQAAIKLMEGLIAAEPEIASARFLLASEYEKQGELVKASGQYARILQQQPENFLASINMAMLCGKQGAVDDAVAWYQRALEINPNSVSAHLGLGISYRNQQHWQSAAGEFQASLKQEPNFTALYNLGAIHLLQNEPAYALEEAQSAVLLQPRNWQIFNLLGSIYLTESKLAEAENILRHALDLNPDSEEARMNLAQVLHRTGRQTEARALIQEELKAHPGQPTAQALLDQLAREGEAQ